MSDSDAVGKLKDLMPYILAAIILICLTTLRHGDKISEEHFLIFLGTVAGYIFGDVTGMIRLRRLTKLLHAMEEQK